MPELISVPSTASDASEESDEVILLETEGSPEPFIATAMVAQRDGQGKTTTASNPQEEFEVLIDSGCNTLIVNDKNLLDFTRIEEIVVNGVSGQTSGQKLVGEMSVEFSEGSNRNPYLNSKT